METSDKTSIQIDYSYIEIKDDRITFSVHKVDKKEVSSLQDAETSLKATIELVKIQLEFEFTCKQRKKSKRGSAPNSPISRNNSIISPTSKKVTTFSQTNKKMTQLLSVYGPKNNFIDNTSSTKALYTKPKKSFKGIGTLHDSSVKREKTKEKNMIPLETRNTLAFIDYAFNNHQHLCLSPSDFIIMIGMGISQHININAEKLRYLFVENNTKGKIQVQNNNIRVGRPYDWSELFDQISDEIKKKVKKDFYAVVIDEFSTATPITKVVSEMTLMNKFKKYFEYIGNQLCGFPKITLKGTKNDWITFKEKIARLIDLNKSDGLDLDWWLRNLVFVVEKICDAGIERKVDHKFWGNLFQKSDDYGAPTISGWINAFIPYKYSRNEGYVQNQLLKNQIINSDFVFEGGIEKSEVPLGISKVPFNFVDLDGVVYNMRCYSGMLGAKYDKKNDWIEPAYFWTLYENAEL